MSEQDAHASAQNPPTLPVSFRINTHTLIVISRALQGQTFLLQPDLCTVHLSEDARLVPSRNDKQLGRSASESIATMTDKSRA